MYAKAIRSELKKNGHIVEMKFTMRRETLKNVKRIVIAEELLRRKHDDNSILDTVERKVFWNNCVFLYFCIFVFCYHYATTRA